MLGPALSSAIFRLIIAPYRSFTLLCTRIISLVRPFVFGHLRVLISGSLLSIPGTWSLGLKTGVVDPEDPSATAFLILLYCSAAASDRLRPASISSWVWVIWRGVGAGGTSSTFGLLRAARTWSENSFHSKSRFRIMVVV